MFILDINDDFGHMSSDKNKKKKMVLEYEKDNIV